MYLIKKNMNVEVAHWMSNAVMSATMTGLKSGTIGHRAQGIEHRAQSEEPEREAFGGIYFSMPVENDLNRLFDSQFVSEPACLPVGKSAFGACGEPLGTGQVLDSIERIEGGTENRSCRFVTDTGIDGITTVSVVSLTGKIVTDKRYQGYQKQVTAGCLSDGVFDCLNV